MRIDDTAAHSESGGQGEDGGQQPPGEAGAGSAVENEGAARPAFYEYWNRFDMLTWMGARITDSQDGHATVYFEPDTHHRGAGVGGRAVTGAVQAYIFDIVTGAAVASLAHGTKPQVTVKLDVTFERPAYDDPLTFEAHVLSGGRQIVFVEGTCRDRNAQVTSRCVAIYRRFEKRLQAPEEAARGE